MPGTRPAHAPLAVLRVQAEGSGGACCFKGNLGWIPLQQRAAPLDADNKNIVLAAKQAAKARLEAEKEANKAKAEIVAKKKAELAAAEAAKQAEATEEAPAEESAE